MASFDVENPDNCCKAFFCGTFRRMMEILDKKLETDPPKPNITGNPSPISELHKTPTHPVLFLIKHIIVGIICIASFPLILILGILSIFLTGKITRPAELFKPKKHLTKGSIFGKMLKFESVEAKMDRLKMATTVRLGCLSLLWLVINLCLPSLRNMAFLGSLLWKWSLLAVVILLGYPCTRFATITLYGVATCLGELTATHDIEYFIWGLMDSFTSFLYFASILVVWLVYFQTERDLRPNQEGVHKYGTWSFVSLLVGATLGLLKSVVLLKWKAKEVFIRFKARILMAGFRLFFLSVISEKTLDCRHYLLPWRYQRQYGGEWRKIRINGKSIQEQMLSKHVTLMQIETVARLIVALAQVILREDDPLPDVVRSCQEQYPCNNGTCRIDDRHTMEKFLADKMKDAVSTDARLFEKLKVELLSNGSTLDDKELCKWLVDAHFSYLSLGYTLIDAFAVVRVLDVVLTCCIVALVILFWLLVTGLATTKVLVTIASTFLALTFMFGDTCKAFFQGVIFSFVTHPFDVDDRCIINGVEVVVKQIGILTTTCFKVGTDEKILYPNTDLVTKPIINLEGKPDSRDVIELVLDPSTKSSQITGLKNRIEEYLHKHDGCFIDKDYEVLVKEMGNSIKMSIRFKHVLNVQVARHLKSYESARLDENRQRSEFFMEIMKYLEELQIKFAAL